MIFAFWFFLLLSGFIGFAIYVLLTVDTAQRRAIGLPTVGKPIGLAIGLLAWIAVFLLIYVGSLAGYRTVVVGNDGIRLEYVIPARSVSLSYADLREVTSRPAYKSLWRMDVSTTSGDSFHSAPGSKRTIKAAVDEIVRRRGGITP